MADILSAAEVELIAARHTEQPSESWEEFEANIDCQCCHQQRRCDAERLSASHAELQRRLPVLEAALELVQIDDEWKKDIADWDDEAISAWKAAHRRYIAALKAAQEGEHATG